MNNIPLHLKKSPIVESVFEVMYKGKGDISAMIPGILYSKLGKAQVLQVPQIPIEIIKSDPNMSSIPTFSLDWGDFFVSGNPYYVAISAKKHYNRWTNFKEGVSHFHESLFDSDIFESITRYSIRYVDLIPVNEGSPIDLLNIEIKINHSQIKNENAVLQAELQDGEYLHVIRMATSATLFNDREKEQGLLLDIGTLMFLSEPIIPAEFMKGHSTKLDDIHEKNKQMFFGLLSEKCINQLEPVYE